MPVRGDARWRPPGSPHNRVLPIPALIREQLPFEHAVCLLSYGQILLLKLALVVIAAALGGHNRFFGMPRLLSSLKEARTEITARPLKRFAAVLHVESVVLAGVLVAAAVLVSSPLLGTP
ncbi:hypothetical protein GCT13_00890 [Paraburkholderia sp. CNPSo 3157]|uniref:Copper resistance protein D domain-containing protein n=1 Tax=Paraburkholderia franconis TaxID=2654983 RepID=A0A7X1N5M0_9BURK|nr:hypothetical protein [Paraburkholderia franconis]